MFRIIVPNLSLSGEKTTFFYQNYEQNSFILLKELDFGGDCRKVIVDLYQYLESAKEINSGLHRNPLYGYPAIGA